MQQEGRLDHMIGAFVKADVVVENNYVASVSGQLRKTDEFYLVNNTNGFVRIPFDANVVNDMEQLTLRL